MEELYRHCALVEVELVDGKFRFTKDRTFMACWLPSAGLQCGKIVSLKNRTDKWQIVGIGSQEMERSQLHTDWNNDI